MYVLKAMWETQPVYFKFFSYDESKNIKIVNLSEVIDDATIYETEEEAIKALETLNDSLFKIYPVCPKCKMDYSEHPALSRDDDKTLICPSCGIKEAVNQYIEYKTSN